MTRRILNKFKSYVKRADGIIIYSLLEPGGGNSNDKANLLDTDDNGYKYLTDCTQKGGGGKALPFHKCPPWRHLSSLLIGEGRVKFCHSRSLKSL